VKILIIDDEPHIVRALTLLLQRAGHDIQTAHNGADGLTKLAAERPDLAIIDMMMPRLTGLELLQAWQERAGTSHADDVQFIMLTASCDAEIKEGLECFANVQLAAKPFSPRHILQMVEALDAHRAAGHGAV
jgi:DNA-binding response OmpR family regulator